MRGMNFAGAKTFKWRPAALSAELQLIRKRFVPTFLITLAISFGCHYYSARRVSERFPVFAVLQD